MIASRHSYHGNTLGALAAGGNERRRQQFQPLLIEVRHVSPCYVHREHRANESSEHFATRLVQELEAKILRLGAEQVMTFVAEPVVGATLRAAAAVPGYFKKIREHCDRCGVLLILDEVMCGLGRTGTLFVAEKEGITADLITIAKGLGAGCQPLGATLPSGRIRDAIA